MDSEDECFRALAVNVIHSQVHTNDNYRISKERFRYLAKDYLCPTVHQWQQRSECFNALERAEKRGQLVYTPTPHNGNTADCDISSCDVELVRSGEDNKLRVVAPRNPRPTTMAREYLNMLRGYDYLRSSQRNVE